MNMLYSAIDSMESQVAQDTPGKTATAANSKLKHAPTPQK